MLKLPEKEPRDNYLMMMMMMMTIIFLLFDDILYKIPLKGRKRGTLLHPQVSYIHGGSPSACVYPVVGRSDELPIASLWFPTFPNQIFSMCFSVLVSS